MECAHTKNTHTHTSWQRERERKMQIAEKLLFEITTQRTFKVRIDLLCFFFIIVSVVGVGFGGGVAMRVNIHRTTRPKFREWIEIPIKSDKITQFDIENKSWRKIIPGFNRITKNQQKWNHLSRWLSCFALRQPYEPRRFIDSTWRINNANYVFTNGLFLCVSVSLRWIDIFHSVAPSHYRKLDRCFRNATIIDYITKIRREKPFNFHI